jgi:hypothetical protein
MRIRSTVWYNGEADYLEVLFDKKEGYFRKTDNDAVMKRQTISGTSLAFRS